MYFSNWLHGDMRQYDISDPGKPKLTGQVWIGGMLGKAPEVNGRKSRAGRRCSSSSLDGKRLYCTTSLALQSWDNQFYPRHGQAGLLHAADRLRHGQGRACGSTPTSSSTSARSRDGPARAHEMRYPGGDCTSDIWL